MEIGFVIVLIILLFIIAILNDRLNSQREMYFSLKKRIETLEERYYFKWDDLK